MDAGDAQKDGLLRSRFLAWLLSTEDLHQIRRRSTPRRKNAGDSGDQSATNPRKRFDAKSLEEFAPYVPEARKPPFVSLRRCVPEDGKLRIEPGDAFFEWHTTCDGGTCPSDGAMKGP